MFGSNIVRSAITIPKIISGVGSVLNVANRIIPIYKQVKPMIIKSQGLIKTLQNGLQQYQKNIDKVSVNNKTNDNIKNKNTSSLPVFFQ